jgi:pimeloyl-ACP methyl ester carboxylesterase
MPTRQLFLTAAIAGLLSLLLFVASAAAAYDYPVENPYEATVIGIPPDYRYQWEVPRDVRPRMLTLNFGKDLSWIPLAQTFGIADLKLYFAPQHGPAPLIFVIAGTGAAYDSPKTVFLMDTFYQAGYHVITISSPTKPPFIAAVSTNNLPGVTQQDAEDLYRVMQKTLETITGETEITAVDLTGYSLGGLDAAFVGNLDRQRREINFRKVLMINPPVNPYTSMSILDSIIPNYRRAHPDATGEKVFDFIFNRLAGYFKDTGGVTFGPETVYDIQKSNQALPIKDIKLLVGVSFLFSSADFAFTADALNHTGWIIPAEDFYSPLSGDLNYWYKRSLHWNFLAYFDRMIVPWWQARHPGDTREDIIHKNSLYAIEEYLRDNDSVGVMHNRDDITLAPGDIKYLEAVMGERAVIFPHGGHCGNLEYRDNVAAMLDFFAK